MAQSAEPETIGAALACPSDTVEVKTDQSSMRPATGFGRYGNGEWACVGCDEGGCGSGGDVVVVDDDDGGDDMDVSMASGKGGGGGRARSSDCLRIGMAKALAR